MSEFILRASERSHKEQGKGASRRLRKQNLVPAIIYGGEGKPVAISLKNNELVKALQSESFFSSLIKLELDGQSEEVIIKALQRHPAKDFALHVDFMRVVRGQLMHFTVPVHYTGVAEGVTAGGILTTNVTEVEITCLPRQLPEFLEVDVSKLSVGDVLRLSDIKLTDGITITQLESDGTNRVIVSVQPPVVEPEPQENADAEMLVEDLAPTETDDAEKDADD